MIAASKRRVRAGDAGVVTSLSRRSPSGVHSKIHDRMTFLIRQLSPTQNGLPLEIYVFSNDVDWIAYEGIQSDIFDHLLAIVPEFGLRVFQQPTGQDFQSAFSGGGEQTVM